MKVRYTETALSEIEQILSFIAAEDPVVAGEVSRAIERAVVWAALRPLASPVIHRDNVRARLARPFQYRIFYEIAGDDLIVRNVRSTRRQRPWERE